MTEFWQEEKIEYKKRCEKRNSVFEPKLIKAGAVQKQDGIYELDGWLCYPTKGFAMNKRNSKQKMNLSSFLMRLELKSCIQDQAIDGITGTAGIEFGFPYQDRER